MPKLDRNTDGCVSKREFIGPAEAFRKLDARLDRQLWIGDFKLPGE